VAANEAAQTLRQSGKLDAARQQLRACVAAACPAVLRDDCAQRLDELQRAQPTVVFDVKDAAGHDVATVRVSVDGRLVAERVDGTAMPLDPGEHEVRFDAAPAAREEGSSPLSGQRLVGLGVAGAGAAGLIVGAVFGANAMSSWSSSKSECSASSCPSHDQAVADHDHAASAATLSTVAFVAGTALVAGGLVLYLTAPSSRERPSGQGAELRLAPAAGARGGGVELQGVF
jgi:hypothetical protein